MAKTAERTVDAGTRSQRRDEIVEVASSLLRDKGIGISLQDIADELGVTYNALYHHFKSREDLIFTKEQLLAPLLPGMEAPPHPMRLGDDEKDYYLRVPGSAPAEVPGLVSAPR